MRTNERSTIYWTFNNIEDDFNIESNERAMTMISTDITLTTTNSWTLRILLMTFTLDILIERTKKIHSCEHTLLKRRSNITISTLFLIYSRLYSRSILDSILDLFSTLFSIYSWFYSRPILDSILDLFSILFSTYSRLYSRSRLSLIESSEHSS